MPKSNNVGLPIAGSVTSQAIGRFVIEYLDLFDDLWLTSNND